MSFLVCHRGGVAVVTHRELSFQVLFGRGLPNVATLGKTWIALYIMIPLCERH